MIIKIEIVIIFLFIVYIIDLSWGIYIQNNLPAVDENFLEEKKSEILTKLKELPKIKGVNILNNSDDEVHIVLLNDDENEEEWYENIIGVFQSIYSGIESTLQSIADYFSQ